MDKINNLLKLATSYCERATWSYLVNKAEIKSILKEAAGDTGLYDEMLLTAKSLDDKDLGSEIQLLAESYKKVLEMGAGYNTIKNDIDKIFNVFMDEGEDEGDEDEESNTNAQQQVAEKLLNKVLKDVRARAGGPVGLAKPDPPNVVQELKQIKNKFNTESLAEDFENLQQFDPTAGLGGGGDGGKAPNRGVMFRSFKSPKDWAEFFADERDRYQDDLATENKKLIKDKIAKLIDVLTKLEANIIRELELMAEISVLKTPNPTLNKELEDLRQSTKALRKERRSLKVSIRDNELAKQKQRLEEEAKFANTERDQIRLKHEAELYNLLMSKDLGKKEERNWRRALVKSMSGGNWPGIETLKNMEKNIQEASKKRKTRNAYEAERGAKIKEHFEEGHDPEKRTRGKAKTFVGLVTDLQQKLATQKIVVKQTITDAIVNRIVVEQHTTFKPYKDKIAQAEQARQEARKRKDKAAVDAATQIIKEVSKQMADAMDKKAINAEAELSPQIVQFVEKLKPFYNFRDQAKIIAESIGENNIPQESWESVSPVIEEGKALAKQFTGVQYMDTIAKAVSEIVASLERRMVKTARRYISLTNILANSTLWKKYE